MYIVWDQKVPSFQKGALKTRSFSLWKNRPLKPLNSPPSNAGSPNHLSLLILFTLWIIQGKRKFWSFAAPWNWSEGSCNSQKGKKPTGKNPLLLAEILSTVLRHLMLSAKPSHLPDTSLFAFRAPVQNTLKHVKRSNLLTRTVLRRSFTHAFD